MRTRTRTPHLQPQHQLQPLAAATCCMPHAACCTRTHTHTRTRTPHTHPHPAVAAAAASAPTPATEALAAAGLPRSVECTNLCLQKGGKGVCPIKGKGTVRILILPDLNTSATECLRLTPITVGAILLHKGVSSNPRKEGLKRFTSFTTSKHNSKCSRHLNLHLMTLKHLGSSIYTEFTVI